MMHTAWIEGVALWGSCLPGWPAARAILRGESAMPQSPAPRPTHELLPPNERRRAPDTVAIAVEVAARACADAGRDPATLACVFASTHGDLGITDYMCATLASAPDQISPTRFHNSVHNAAAGYWTIATGCTAPYTALSARACTFGEALVEALAQAHCDAGAVLLVAYDIEARGPLAAVAPSPGLLAAGLVLAGQPSARARARLRWRVCEQAAPRDPTSRAPALVAASAMASCLPLFELLAAQAGGRVAYPLGPRLAIGLEVGTAAPADAEGADAR
jgi:hypothetical protein